tara:strand:+ start:816 stop:4376 length:3561 start_codon:yes stop_codon:yes gene_type:complete
MSKSNYPNKIDTSVEIPAVRDNITEIGSDVLNSLRSAIFNIEKTLGINPQGTAGNTLSARLSNIIDENGNLKDEALAKSGLLSGPISNKDVSKTAAIKEFKLDLAYPTTLLQDQISILNSKIQEFVAALNELNSIISAHVNQSAINRHFAKSISVEPGDVTPSDTGLNSLESQGLQEFIQKIFDSHISYSGTNISESNNSHRANQIFFDNSNNPDLILSDSVQGAIDDIANIEGEGLRSSILNLNSNGRIRSGGKTDALEANNSGSLVTSFSEIIYTSYSGASTTEINFSSSPSLLLDIDDFDIFEISESPTELDNKEYIIKSYELNSDGTLDSIIILGSPLGDFVTGTLGRVKKNTYGAYNQNGLNCSVRPRVGFSNTPSIQACLPNSATIISSGADFSKISSGIFEKISLEIDGGSAVEVPVYDSKYNSHNIDVVVSVINRYCVNNNLNIFAYKIRANKCYELAISHNVPNHSAGTKTRSIKLVASSSLDAYSILGLSQYLNKEIRGSFGNSFHINGAIVSEFGLIKNYTGTSIAINSGTTSLSSTEINFLSLGVRVGDLLVIDESSDSNDDGTYSVKSISKNTIELDYTTSVFSGSSTESSLFTFVRSTAPISELNFVDINGSMIVDVFADEYLNIHYRRRADISGSFNFTNFFMVVTDFSKGFITKERTYNLKVTNSSMASIKLSTGSYGEEVFVGSTGDYIIPSPDGMEFVKVKVFVPNESASIFASASASIDITGYSELPDSLIHMSRCLFSPEFGLVVEDIDSGLGEIGAVGITDKRISGTIDDTIISEPFLERYIQGPRNELRSNGIIRGFEISNISISSSTIEMDVSSGVAIVSGLRVEFSGTEGLTFDFGGGSTNSLYIVLDNAGCIKLGNEVDRAGGTDYHSPFSVENNLHIGYYNSDVSELYDLRVFIDRVDYKLLNNLIVSPEKHMGHFTSIDKAVKYCKVFSKLFKDHTKPRINLAPGIHLISSSIDIDFDLDIIGSGVESVVQRASSYLLENSRPIFRVGNEEVKNDFVYGVTLSDFTYRSAPTPSTSQLAAFAIISHDLNITDNSDYAYFSIKSIRFITPDNTGANGLSEIIFIGTPNNVSKSNCIFKNVLIENCHFHYFGNYFNSASNGIVWCTNQNATTSYKNIIVSNCTRDLEGWSAVAWVYTPNFIKTASSTSYINVMETDNASIE